MRQPRIIRSLLLSALQHWLRSLVEAIDTLEVYIQASDRQLLSGYIPQTSLQAAGAVYAGLHLTQVQLLASTIRVNLGQILRGKSFQLGEPIKVQIQAQVSAQDLNRSLSADLLTGGLATLTQRLLPHGSMVVTHVDLAPGQLVLQGSFNPPQDGAAAGKARHKNLAAPVALSTHVSFQGSNLYFKQIQLLAHPGLTNQALPRSLPDQAFPLGDVQLKTLTLTADGIALEGELKVLP